MSTDICFYTGPVLKIEKKMLKLVKKVKACGNEHCMDYTKETNTTFCNLCKSEIVFIDKKYYDYFNPAESDEYKKDGYGDVFSSCYEDSKFYYCKSYFMFSDKIVTYDSSEYYDQFAFSIPQNIPEMMDEFYKIPDVQSFIEYFKSKFELNFSFEYMTLKYNRYN
jgi:hypothetical protein